ncbi:hypothetical protein ACFZBU_39715 [Embleya sp. NPDC008237]|uniref:hypothetical protein n=1 Tax=Embleya sp. NPDC008237 TaxID=3363978 RepID=UPI0036F00982
MFMPPKDFVPELLSQRALQLGIQRAIANGDQAAKAAFTPRSVFGRMTRKGMHITGREINDYIQRVKAADGNLERAAWLFDL